LKKYAAEAITEAPEPESIGFLRSAFSQKQLQALAQATRRALLLGCSRRIVSMSTCNSVAMLFLASSKLLPWTVTDRLLQNPFHPSSSGEKSQSIGMLALTGRLTT